MVAYMFVWGHLSVIPNKKPPGDRVVGVATLVSKKALLFLDNHAQDSSWDSTTLATMRVSCNHLGFNQFKNQWGLLPPGIQQLTKQLKKNNGGRSGNWPRFFFRRSFV